MTNLQIYALTTLADVKESLNIASSVTKYDNLIKRKINQATGMIESYCQRRFAKTDYVQELYDATHTDQLVLKQRPVDTESTFTLEGRTTTLHDDTFETINTEFFFIDANAGIVNLVGTLWGKWAQYAVTYSAGYSTIPDDLAEACVALACYLFNNADANVQVRSKQEGQRRIDYYQGIHGVSDLFQQLGIDGVLDNYANEGISGSSQS